MTDEFKEMMYKKHMTEIEEHLYLGDYYGATGKWEIPIHTVLTVMDFEIPDCDKNDSITYKRINVDDITEEDILSYFPQSNQIIEECQKSGHNILVHCMAGISRSATVVIAYIMQKYQMPFFSAKKLVESKRSLIHPNHAFEEQLGLYEKMSFTLDANNRQFRQFLNEFHVSRSSFDDFFIKRYFEKLSTAESLTPNLELGLQYNCNNCGTKLFNEIHVLKNVDKNANKDESTDPPCNAIYIEPQKWMTQLLETSDIFDRNIKCINCTEIKAMFRIHKRIECKCEDHWGLRCLRIKVIDNSFKISQ